MDRVLFRAMQNESYGDNTVLKGSSHPEEDLQPILREEAEIAVAALMNREEWAGKHSETDSVKSQISSKTSRRKKDSTKRRRQRHYHDSQVNSYFPYRLSPVTFNIYFYLLLYLYKARKMINKAHHI